MSLLAKVDVDVTVPAANATAARQFGTAELQTDGRVAAVVEPVVGPRDAILVDGARISASQGPDIVALAQRVPLLRLRSGSVAPTMHEVERPAERVLGF